MYNEIDPGKAEWLRQLIKRGIIAPGQIDERPIQQFQPGDLAGRSQCHFFAGIGIWSYALRLAGWPDDREVWTGSCPCQPFSVAGKRIGKADERHLWPAWFNLIAQCRPRVVFGEQVADGDGIAWLDTVQSQMESIDYRIGACVLPAAGFGAPHARHRTFFVADTANSGHIRGRPSQASASERHKPESKRFRDAGQLEQSASKRCRETGQNLGRSKEWLGQRCESQQLVNANEARSQGRGLPRSTGQGNGAGIGTTWSPGPVNGFWANAEWIPCRTEIPGAIKWRPIEPGTQSLVDGFAPDILRLCNYGFPLLKGAEARTIRLKGYGDAIVAETATQFIRAYFYAIQTKAD